MKRVIKGGEPEELRRWKEENVETPQNLIYGNMPTASVKLQMLSEQGYLCAYTMRAISTADSCHIEHVIPQNQPNQPPHHAIDYDNLLACFPGKKPPPNWSPKYPYGAERKGGTHIDGNNFVSPVREDVEQRFQYTYDGSIMPAAGDNAAESTIEILKLDHGQLVELRKAAIDERVLDAPLSAEDAEALSIEIMAKNSTGRFPEFCLAISQVAAWYARKLRRVD